MNIITQIFFMICILMLSLFIVNYLEIIHEKNINITFNDTIKAIEELDINYFLCFGTALGIRRDGEIIKYDDDVDVGIFYEDLSKIDEDVINKAFSNNFKIKVKAYWNCNNTKYPIIYQHKNIKTGIVSDLYIFYDRPELQAKTLYIDGGERTGKGYIFPYSKLNTIEYNGKTFNIMSDEWLTHIYGEWKTPKKGDKGILKPKLLPNNSNCIIQPPYI